MGTLSAHKCSGYIPYTGKQTASKHVSFKRTSTKAFFFFFLVSDPYRNLRTQIRFLSTHHNFWLLTPAYNLSKIQWELQARKLHCILLRDKPVWHINPEQEFLIPGYHRYVCKILYVYVCMHIFLGRESVSFIESNYTVFLIPNSKVIKPLESSFTSLVLY